MLTGGAGHDTFVFSGGGGHDLIMDFKAGEDMLQVARNINGLSIAKPEDLLSHVSTDAHGNAVIDLGHGDTVTLNNVSATDIQHNPNAYFHIA